MAALARQSPGPSRFVLPVAGLIGLGLVVVGILVLDRPARWSEPAGVDLRGDGQRGGREALRNGQGDQFLAKLLLAAIALVVGVGGIWLLFTGVSSSSSCSRRTSVTGSCRGSSSRRRWCF